MLAVQRFPCFVALSFGQLMNVKSASSYIVESSCFQSGSMVTTSSLVKHPWARCWLHSGSRRLHRVVFVSSFGVADKDCGRRRFTVAAIDLSHGVRDRLPAGGTVRRALVPRKVVVGVPRRPCRPRWSVSKSAVCENIGWTQPASVGCSLSVFASTNSTTEPKGDVSLSACIRVGCLAIRTLMVICTTSVDSSAMAHFKVLVELL